MELLKNYLTEICIAEHCDFVYNGEDAVKVAAKNLKEGKPTTHVLIDFMMPRLNGIQAHKKI